MIDNATLTKAIKNNVELALSEDIGNGDITAQLIPASQQASAKVITRENMVLCGVDWANAVFQSVDQSMQVQWHKAEGDLVEKDECFLSLSGNARSILTAERCALNFIQTLSGTATLAKHYAEIVEHTQVKLLDTRKTLPGLRVAQKYAVSVGGCHNHRMGLYDAFLIKENHIISCGSIKNAVQNARELAPGKLVEIEVESLDELDLALAAGADVIMLDNFSLEEMRAGVARATGRAKLEASGNVTNSTITPIAETGVDYISIGALTKDVKSIDLSMRFSADQQVSQC
jgi:nicotinate-nucleotide pyrophosphorylase (carboxylating)